MESDQARRSFEDAISLWRFNPSQAVSEVIDAATNCLVAGLDSPSLRELAGASPKESRFALDELILATVNELGMSELLNGDAARAALAVSLRKMLDGRMTPRELAKWTYRAIGYDIEPDGYVFVNMDDLYDESDQGGYNVDELDRWMLGEAEAFLAGRPSPGPPPAWRQHLPLPPKPVGRFRRWVNRRHRNSR